MWVSLKGAEMISHMKFTAIVAVMVVATTLLVGCSSGASQDDLDDLKSRITVVSGEVDQLQQQLDEPADGGAFLTQESLFETLQNPSAGQPNYIDSTEHSILMDGLRKSLTSGNELWGNYAYPYTQYFSALNTADFYLAEGDAQSAADWVATALAIAGVSGGCRGGELVLETSEYSDESYVMPNRLVAVVRELLGPLYTVEEVLVEGEEAASIVTQTVIKAEQTISAGC